MKKSLFLIAILASQSAWAMPILKCQNPATGAAFSVVFSSDEEAPSYAINPALARILEQQGSPRIDLQGTGGSVSPDPVVYAVYTASGYLTVQPAQGGYLLTLAQYRQPTSQSFYFNAGECRTPN